MIATRASRLQLSGVISKLGPGSPPPATCYMGLACINHTPTNHTFPPQRTQSADTVTERSDRARFTESKYPRSKSEP